MVTREGRRVGTRSKNENVGLISRRWRVSATICPQRPEIRRLGSSCRGSLAKRLFYLCPAICQTPYEAHALPTPSRAALLLVSLRALSLRRCSIIERSSPWRISCRAPQEFSPARSRIVTSGCGIVNASRSPEIGYERHEDERSLGMVVLRKFC